MRTIPTRIPPSPRLATAAGPLIVWAATKQARGSCIAVSTASRHDRTSAGADREQYTIFGVTAACPRVILSTSLGHHQRSPSSR
jgi:hypothetical protein